LQAATARWPIAAFDWSGTPIGAAASWSPALRMAIRMMLANPAPAALWWGAQHLQFYNDACRVICGDRHPHALGQAARECWAAMWQSLSRLTADSPPSAPEDIRFEVRRNGTVQEAWFAAVCIRVPDDTAPDGIGGLLAIFGRSLLVYTGRGQQT
jgi:hypothetical protein